MSEEQRDALDQLLRDAPLDLGGHVAEQRAIFEQMMAAIPVPADVTTSSGSLGGMTPSRPTADCSTATSPLKSSKQEYSTIVRLNIRCSREL